MGVKPNHFELCLFVPALLFCGCGAHRIEQRQPRQVEPRKPPVAPQPSAPHAAPEQEKAAQPHRADKQPLRIEQLLRIGGHVYWRKHGVCVDWRVVPDEEYPHDPHFGALERSWHKDGRTIRDSYGFAYKSDDSIAVAGRSRGIYAADGSMVEAVDSYCITELAIRPYDSGAVRIGSQLWFGSRAACEATLFYAGAYAGRSKKGVPCGFASARPRGHLSRARRRATAHQGDGVRGTN